MQKPSSWVSKLHIFISNGISVIVVQYLSVQLPFTYKNSDFKVILQVNGN
jgi:hypothetical protein